MCVCLSDIQMMVKTTILKTLICFLGLKKFELIWKKSLDSICLWGRTR